MSTIIGSASALSIERGARVAMPDGVALATDIVRPQTSEPVPALLVRTPYGRDPGVAAGPADAIRLVEAGYALVTQDVRGRFDSGGTFSPFRDEPGDGVATIDWLAAQPWCDGKVGAVGWVVRRGDPVAGCRPGATQPVRLRSIRDGLGLPRGLDVPGRGVPARIRPSLDDRVAVPGPPAGPTGCRLGGARGTRSSLRGDRGRLPPPAADRSGLPRRGRPVLRASGSSTQARDGWWREVAPRERYEAVTAPALNIGGWYDIFVGGTVENYRGLRDRGGSPEARSGTRLIVGPWSHSNETRTYPERTYGWGAELDALDPTALHLRFFDRWLRGIDDGIDREPPVRLFVMGADRWQDEADWPPPDARAPAVVPAQRRGARTRRAGTGHCPPSRRTMSPPTPTGTTRTIPFRRWAARRSCRGGRPGWNDGPWDQRSLAGRRGRPAVTRPRHSIVRSGSSARSRLVLHAASSALDTDFTARLIDVQPDGRAEILTEGILRARYRESLAEARLLEPGSVVELRIRVGPTANVFLAGHRIRVDVSSSSFPRFDAEPEHGRGSRLRRAGDAVVAENTVFHDRRHPSHVLLPIVDRDWRLG